ncbi:hypothetical protein [Halovivax limisalsi]|uniref:hypothetical protein n=1 Tax=Halovivax limisalsi TaxID=1453760 RepID=UPI001FFC4A94|nr:hypothetical protein [Halovivax limisalsi]
MAHDDAGPGGRRNAVLGWALTGAIGLAAVASVRSGALLWGGFAIVLGAVASTPAVIRRDWTAMAPWPLLATAAIAVGARAIELYPDVAGFLAIAALALVLVVELDAFTPVELGPRFAVVFGVLTTLAIESLWIVAQYYSDGWFGTDFLRTQSELQRDIATVTVVGFLAGGLFYWYFTRGEAAGSAYQSTRTNDDSR